MNTNFEGEFEKRELRKNRVISFILGVQLIVALMFLTFGLYQQTLQSKNEEKFAQQRQENAIKLEVAIKELEACQQNK